MSSKLVTVNEFETKAYEILPQNARDYYKSGAGDEHTLSLNKDVFKRYDILDILLAYFASRFCTCATYVLYVFDCFNNFQKFLCIYNIAHFSPSGR